MTTALRDERKWIAPFVIIWIGQASSLFGSGVASFALIWWLTEQTGSATVLAIATLVTILPGVLVGPLAGALIDRWDRRAIMVVADLLGAVAAGVLALLFWANALEVWYIYLVMALRSLAGAFHWPAMQASTTLLVPEAQLARVAGLTQMIQGATTIVAPPLGALLISLLPLYSIMAIDVVTALIAVFAMLQVAIPRPPRAEIAPISAGAVWGELVAGLRYIWHWPGLLGIMLIATVLNLLLTPAFALLPILVTQHFSGGALELAWLNTANGVGFVAGGLLLGVWGGFRRRIFTTLFGLFGMGLGTLAMAGAPAEALPLALGGMLLVGIMSPICNGPLMAIVQSVVAPEMQGRVFTVLSSLAMGMSPLGLVVAGPVADTLGVRAWFVVGAVACFLLGVLALCVPAIRLLEQKPRQTEPAPQTQLVVAE